MKLEKLKIPQPKARNFVVKNMQMSGAGVHQEKAGKKRAKRAKQKHQLRRDFHDMYEATDPLPTRLQFLLRRLNDVSSFDAPPELSNEEAGAWANGVQWALEQVEKEVGTLS